MYHAEVLTSLRAPSSFRFKDLSLHSFVYFFYFGNGKKSIRRNNLRYQKPKTCRATFRSFGWSLFPSSSVFFLLFSIWIASRWLRLCIAMHFRQRLPKNNKKNENAEKEGDWKKHSTRKHKLCMEFGKREKLSSFSWEKRRAQSRIIMLFARTSFPKILQLEHVALSWSIFQRSKH